MDKLKSSANPAADCLGVHHVAFGAIVEAGFELLKIDVAVIGEEAFELGAVRFADRELYTWIFV